MGAVMEDLIRAFLLVMLALGVVIALAPLAGLLG